MIVIVLISFSAYSATAQQQERGGKKKPPTFDQLIEEMDANEDGLLSKKEIKGPLKKHFDKVDTNEDGHISKKEFENMPKPEHKRRPSNNR